MYWKEREKEKSIITKKYHQGPEKKCNELKTDIETKSQCDSIEKGNFREILNKKKNMKKKKYQENPKPKKEYEKINIRKILDKKENMKKNKYADNPQRQRKYEKKIWGKSWTKKRIWKNIYEENPEPKREYEKKTLRKILNQKNKITKRCIKRTKNALKRLKRFLSKYDRAPISFAQCAIGAVISAVSDYLNMKNIIFLLHNYIALWDHLMKKLIYLIHVINSFLEMKYLVRLSSVKWV